MRTLSWIRRRSSGLARRSWLGLALAPLWGCAITVDEVRPDLRPEPAYDVLYPYYVEVCAVSQIRAVFAQDGGSPGHAVMYLKGATIDRSADYPRLKLCDPETTDLTDPESGVGISVNKTFSNVNWMAVEGKQLFFDGNLEPGATVDRTAMEDVILDAVMDGVWDGIELHQQYDLPEDDIRGRAMLVASESIGTDFAILFGRHVYAARLPMTREALGRVVDYLNGLNDEYALGDVDYDWSGYHDNCVHALHNSLAAAYVWKKQAIRTTKFKQMFNLAIPANQMIKVAMRGNDFPIESFDKVWRDDAMRKALMKENWLPVQHGVLLKYRGVHQPNELYGTQQTILVGEMWPFRKKSRRIRAMAQQGRYTLVEENLLWFEGRYASILAERPVGWDEPDPDDEYEVAHARYYEYVEKQLADVRAKLEQLYEFRATQEPDPAQPPAPVPEPTPAAA